jgi:23S rRNA (cytidine1920-2'-O)/16S rRNA (cytidine1409-2'-O)-methyltransferase
MKIKKRLDLVLADIYPQYSRTQLQSFIMQGKVFIDGVKVTKPGVIVGPEAEVVCTAEQPKYVCRAGWKLEKALDYFGIDVAGLIVLDAGMSTGGFTDCMLQRDVKKVFGVDVGHTQAHEKIRQDARVVVLERMNLKEYQHEGEPIDLITLDLSFISLLKVMDVVDNLLAPHGKLVTLIKPQFEADRSEVPAGGVIKDAALQQRLVDSVVAGIQEHGFVLQGITESPILGAAGNREFLAYFTKL